MTISLAISIDPGSPDFLAMAFCMLVLKKSQAAKKPEKTWLLFITNTKNKVYNQQKPKFTKPINWIHLLYNQLKPKELTW